ncbi:CoA transferase, partial [Enterococcus hirae]
YRAREATVTVDDPDLGEAVVQSVVPKFSEPPGRVRHLGADLGEHNDAVYGDLLGYDEELRAELGEEGVV